MNNEKLEIFYNAKKEMCDNANCSECPLSVKVLHIGEVKDICDIIEESRGANEIKT